ncbi:hypothetical protein P43SY_000438 [Pythium insidiosum]|uniref:Uncharacterized protein n=1 Tax=Pythium insidiosum TaxID=114742 RepID=A0AAD5Q6E7_PYTIN|nr:hypothetical protein P43SY_000438 [Pythium insidiosum]
MELCGPHKKRVKTDSAAAAASPPSPEAETADMPRLLTPSPTSPPANPNGVRQGQGQGGFRGKCLYQSRKCENERALKRNGQPHNLCEEHRAKQNQHQRKFDAKKFSRRRRNGEDGVDDATHGDDGSQSSRGSGQPEGYLPTASSPSATLRESDLPDGPIVLPNTPTQFPSGAAGRPNRRCAPMAMRRDVRLRHELGLMRYRGRDTLYTDIGAPSRLPSLRTLPLSSAMTPPESRGLYSQ